MSEAASFSVTNNETANAAATVSEIIRTIPGNDQLGMNTGNRTIANLNICCRTATDSVERMTGHRVFPVSDVFPCDYKQIFRLLENAGGAELLRLPWREWLFLRYTI